MTHYHVGILVRDVEQAARRFEEVLGVRFLPPVQVGPFDDGGRTRIAFTSEGPPYLELVEATGSGVMSAEQGEGFHHIGVSDPDAPGRCRALEAAAVPVQPLLVDEAGAPTTAFTDPAALFGVRVEIVAEAARARMDAWIESARGA